MAAGASGRQIGGGGNGGGRGSLLPSSGLGTAIIIVLLCANAYLLQSRVAGELGSSLSMTASLDDRPPLVDSAVEGGPPPIVGGGVGNVETSNNSSNNVVREEVEFLKFSWNYHQEDDPNGGEINHKDAFSASWWMPASKVVRANKFEKVGLSPEGASFDLFITAQGDIRVTRDWLDLSVEHMSKWWKIILEYRSRGSSKKEQELAQNIEKRIAGIFEEYVHSRDRLDFFNALPSTEEGGGKVPSETLVTQSTLAVIAYMPDRSQKAIWGLAATLMSLKQAGMGRIVVAGNNPSDADIVKESFDIVTQATSTWSKGETQQITTELQFCRSANATTDDRGLNIPQAVLKSVRHVFQNRTSTDDSHCWLGGSKSQSSLEERRKRWKYAMLSEPDLLLVTKPDALPGLGKALREGRILAMHRLQPLPHESDFADVEGMADEEINPPGIRVIPDAPPFENVVEIDAFSSLQSDSSSSSSSSFDSCCDRGTYKPYLVHKECETPFWWMCGYYAMRRNPASLETKFGQDVIPAALAAHKRLIGYPLMRLKRGTGVVYASAEWGKTCRPQRGTCTRWEPPQGGT